MRYLILLIVTCCALAASAQKKPMPHGMVYGNKPDTSNIVPANRVEAFMDKKVRISSTVRGKVIRVTKPKGGWFEVDAGNGKIIAAHFRDYNVTTPVELKGKIVLIEGVAQKQFEASGKAKTGIKIDPKRRLTFEVKGLMVEK
ncbi:DUF4920 domain-containing protein [Mucilaginibacter antarcticus]|uniref:DUF4920 domain-containing protein n=1 Tax=Mucilaginibacter antarcticus TaxID=1855725 RepID=A0ABW5XJZ2_9SPHI